MLFHRQAGHGEPMVLLHGLFGSLENLGGIARHLAEQFQVFSIDLPNHGRSPHLFGGDLRVMAEQLSCWMDLQGLTDANLVGHSLGGKVAMELALTQPRKVRSLAVLDIAPVGYPRRHDDVFAGLFAIDIQAIERRSDAEQVLQQFIHSPEVLSFLLKNLVKKDTGFYWRMNLVDLRDQYEQLIRANREGKFEGPVLFLKGEHSDYITPANEQDVLRRFPNAQLRVVSKTGHWLHAEKPELVSKLISKFITNLDASEPN